MNGEIKIGKLLCDEDIITKRQLNKALQAQIKGDKRTLGEILVHLGFCDLDDITDMLLNQDDIEQQHKKEEDEERKKEERKEEIQAKEVKAQIIEQLPIVAPTPEPAVKEPIELSEDKVMDTKFTLSVQTMVGAGMGLASLIGMWYTLQGEIQEAKELPSLESLYQAEYPSKPQGHNWPRSYEQYKTQVGSLQEDMDAVYETLDEYEEEISDLKKLVGNLRVQVANKKDK
jgi:hypothetical protein|tara:strand:+ start:56 stop:745 length:690 start_codon:yes stop_codon:yes gene_type:complete